MGDMALEVASRTALNGPLLSRTVTSALATRSLPVSRAATLPILRTQQRRQLHVTPRSRAPSSGLMGISNSNVPSSYFQRPRLPANTVVKFVPQQTAWIVERMGKFNRILTPGLAVLWPFLDRIAYVKSLKEAAIEIPSQSAITADNVTLELDGVLYTRVFDAYKASYGVEDAEYAISQLAQTTMRSEIGQLTLDHVLKERAALNTIITSSNTHTIQANKQPKQSKWRPSRTPPTTSPSPSRAEVPKLRRRPTSKLLRTVMPASEPVPLLPRMPSQTRLINPPTRARLISTRRLLSTKLLATNKQTYLTTVR